VEVSPLVLIENERQLEEIRKRRLLRATTAFSTVIVYAYLPGLADRMLVVGWNRVAGCTTDRERATFAEALVRKRGRFAFPDKFNTGLKKI
jgi:hypothetical protein